jgi:protein-L-isoaspartate O-methyltransferase
VHEVISPLVRISEKVLSYLPWGARLYMEPYREVVLKEIELAQLKPGEKVLQIGSGALPYSAIFLAELAQVSVCALDIDQVAVKRAVYCVEKLGLSAKVKVKEGNGRDFPASDFSAAFVALQAKPKGEILTNLFSQGPGGLRVVVRQPLERFKSQYEAVPITWKCQNKVQQKMLTFSSQLFY